VIRRRLIRALVLVLLLAAGLSGCGGGGASVADFCKVIKKDQQLFQQIGGMKDAVDAARAAMQELEANSPGGIKDSVKTLSDTFEKVASGDIDGFRRDAAEFTAATKRVVAYTKDQCGFDLDAA
jgi:hypothetical protein